MLCLDLWLCNCCLFLFETYYYIYLFVLVEEILEHMKVRQEAKTPTDEPKQEAEGGSVQMEEDTAQVESQLHSGEQKETETKEDTSPQGKHPVHLSRSDSC